MKKYIDRLKDIEVDYNYLYSLFKAGSDIKVINISNLAYNSSKKYVFCVADMYSQEHGHVIKLIKQMADGNLVGDTWNKYIKYINGHTGLVLLTEMQDHFSEEEIEEILLPEYNENVQPEKVAQDTKYVIDISAIYPTDILVFNSKDIYKNKTKCHTLFGEYVEVEPKYTISFDDFLLSKTNEELARAIKPESLRKYISLHEKELKMKNTNKMTAVLDKNTDSAKVAAKVAAGMALNKVVMEKVKGNLPMMVRGYSDHALANVVLANIVSFAVDNFAADNTKAKWASDAMMVAAMTDFMNSFNFEKLLSDVLTSASINIPDITE